MILSKSSVTYFQSLHSRVLQNMAKHQTKTPYLYDGEVFLINTKSPQRMDEDLVYPICL